MKTRLKDAGMTLIGCVISLFRSYPELLLILLIGPAPIVSAFLWRSSSLGFVTRWLLSMLAGFILWLLDLFFIFLPRFRRY